MFGRRPPDARLAELERDLAVARAERAALQVQADYWRARAERLIDAAIAKGSGLAPGSTVMVDRSPPTEMVSDPFRGMRVTEIESGKPRAVNG